MMFFHTYRNSTGTEFSSWYLFMSLHRQIAERRLWWIKFSHACNDLAHVVLWLLGLLENLILYTSGTIFCMALSGQFGAEAHCTHHPSVVCNFLYHTANAHFSSGRMIDCSAFTFMVVYLQGLSTPEHLGFQIAMCSRGFYEHLTCLGI